LEQLELSGTGSNGMAGNADMDSVKGNYKRKPFKIGHLEHSYKAKPNTENIEVPDMGPAYHMLQNVTDIL
jgi:hypothetical protein